MFYITKIKYLFCSLLALFFFGCATLPPHSDYQKNLNLPAETDNFILVNKTIFVEPELGVMARYEDKIFPEDSIIVYVYPIRNIQWNNQPQVLFKELDYTLADLDTAIEEGKYKSRSEEIRSDFVIENTNSPYHGVKATFTLTNKSDVIFYSNSFMFIAEDKYIKFSTSFDSRMNKELNGDAIVNELLPLIKVPEESPYMKQKRADHKRKLQDDFIQLLIQSTSEKKT